MTTPHKVMEAVALQFGVPLSTITENDRKRTASDCRKAVTVVLRDHLCLSWGAIAGIMGRARDTVINSHERGHDLLLTDRPFQQQMRGVLARLGITTTATAA